MKGMQEVNVSSSRMTAMSRTDERKKIDSFFLSLMMYNSRNRYRYSGCDRYRAAVERER